MSDYIVSILRTLVPSLWGTGIAWLISHVPALEQVQDELAGIGVVLAAVCIAAYYALIRKIEPRLPRWLAPVLIGSTKQPGLYASQAERSQAAQTDGFPSDAEITD